MGRSENSRNRIFQKENDFVRTKAHDESKLTDPSLIIYYPIKCYRNFHIVANGDQTETIYDFLKDGKQFEEALNTRYFEPDAPNFTPRISGLIDLQNLESAYKLSIIKSANNNPDYCLRYYFNFEKAIPGIGHCIHTYKQDGSPLISYAGEPFEVNLFNNIDETISFYCDILNQENKISILAKYINIKSGNFEIKVINKN